MEICITGFNGEHRDPVSGMVHAGNGYRAYNPVLMRFNCPDTWSPFGAGGINPYVWCNGDPVNRADPDGHHSLPGWLGVGISLAIDLLLAPETGGLSLAACFSAMTTVITTGLGIAQQFVGDKNPQAAAALNWATLGIGLVGGVTAALASGKSLMVNLEHNVDFHMGTLIKNKSLFPETFARGERGKFGVAMFGGRERMPVNPTSLAGFSANARINAQGLVEEPVTWPVYRVTRGNTPPLEILQKGFEPSTRFFAVKNMLSTQQKSLIVSDTFQGALNFFNDSSGQYIFRIPPSENTLGVSYVKNFLFNTEKLSEFRIPMYHDDPTQGIWNTMVNDYHRDAIRYAETHISLDEHISTSNLSLVYPRNTRRFSI